MRRREFIAISLGAAARPFVAEAQTTNRIKRVGVVMVGGPHRAGLLGLRDGLKAAGFDEATIVLAVRDVRGDLSAISGLAKELEREGTDVLVVFGTSTALATQRSTEHVPIVFAVGGDPVAFGLVESIAKPGGRLTGLHTIISDLTAKRLELLRQIVPALRRIVTFYNPENPGAMVAALVAMRAAAQDLGIEVLTKEAASPQALREVVTGLRAGDAEALFLISDATVLSEDKLIIEHATALKMPVMAYELGSVSEGALAGYGLHYREFGRVAAEYVTRILAGTSPRDLPVQTVRPVLAINLKTAKALGLTIPPTLLARADEVIE
jgi:putative tryptophan/tyrosine transport system substrate-binding protein